VILYVNGDSHTAAAEAMNPHGFACDDSQYYYLGQVPHPDNLEVSWGKHLSRHLGMSLHCHAQAGCSNDRIIRTAREFLTTFEQEKENWLMIIQWSTWERQEWLLDGVYYQVGASGIDSVPQEYQERYKKFIVEIDWDKCTQEMHDKIWDFHQELAWHKIPHVFFNGDNNFNTIKNRCDWGTNYIGPYDPDQTYSMWLKNNSFVPVYSGSGHFGEDAHSAWADFMLQYIIDNHIL